MQSQTPTAEHLADSSGSDRSSAPIAAVSVLWALFHLFVPVSHLIEGIGVLDSIKVRAIHLAFAMVLLFLGTPVTKGLPQGLAGALSRISHRSLAFIMAAFAAIASLYIMLDWQGIAMRSGVPSARDLFFGMVVILLVLEGARRAIGPALSIIAVVFIAYAFAGPYLPPLLAFRGVSLTKLVTQVALSTEGVYGIPLGVSAQIVFLFVLMGAILERGGAGQFFITLALSLLGRFRGGPAKAAVTASGLMGSISGSSIANIVTTGTFTIPLMKKVGYPPKKAAATEVAASTDGQILPPIMGAAAFIIAEYVNAPYIKVVKAAFIPAVISYCALFYITHLEACKLGLTGMARKDIPTFAATLRDGWHFLLSPAFLVVELLVFRHSAQTAVFRALLVLAPVTVYEQWRQSRRAGEAVGGVIKRSLDVFVRGCVGGCRNMVSVALATAGAGIIVGIINMGIGSMITQIVEVISGGNIVALLVITAVASLLLGMGLPTTATYIVMASLTAPVLVQVGGKYGLEVPLIAAHLFCFYFGILADDTPPVGLASYAAAAIAESDPIPTGIQGFLYDLRTTIVPFMFIFNTNLLLHNVTSWVHGTWIFLTAAIAACMFTSSVQGWFLRRNRWYESLLLLGAALLLFNPEGISLTGLRVNGSLVGTVSGFGLIGLVAVLQKTIGKNHA